MAKEELTPSFRASFERTIDPNKPERCDTCAFWLQETRGLDPDYATWHGLARVLKSRWRRHLLPKGICQRYPLTLVLWLDRRGNFPHTNALMWCGEWRDRSTGKASRVLASRIRST